LSKAYTTIPFAIAQAYLGLPAEELLSCMSPISVEPLSVAQNTFSKTEVASEKGWHFDAATHVMTPFRAARKISSSSSAWWSSTLPLEHCLQLLWAVPSTFTMFNTVADNVARLEV
jgi:hypothetical protein